jgi:hypothetical protein
MIGRTFLEHLLNMRKVFLRFREASLELNPDKCQFLQREVRYLVHNVSPEWIFTYPEKFRAVQDSPTPKNKHVIRSFLSQCAYYRRLFPVLPILQNR